MAFKGGFFIKPVETDFDGLVSLYAQGKAKTEQSRNLRRAERAQQSADLSEKSDFVHTGIEDIDIGHLQAGQLAAQALQDSHYQNTGGKIGINRVNAEFSNQMSQMQVLGKRLELFKANYDATEKRVADGEASIAEKNSLVAGWYPQKGLSGMISLPDGTQRPARKEFYFSHVEDQNGLKKLVVNTDQEYLDENGEVKIYSGRRGLTESVSPNRELINKVTVDDKRAQISEAFGDRETYVNQMQQVVKNPLYPFTQKLANGSTLYVRGVAQETFADVRNTVESNISATSVLEYTSMLAEMGALAPTDLGFKGYKDPQIRENQFAGLYDEKGNKLTFKKDPLVMERDENMRYIINEDNQKLIDALLRDGIYKSMDVTVEEIVSGKVRSRSGSGNTTNYAMSSLPISTITDDKKTESSVANNIYAAGYYRDLMTAEFVLDNAITGGTSASQITDVNNFLRFGYNTDVSKTLFFNNPNIAGLNTANSYVANSEGEIDETKIVGASFNNFKKLYPQAKLTSVAGYEISEVTGMIGVETSTGMQIHFTGTGDIADMKRQQATGGGNSGNNQTTNLVGLTVAKIPVVSKPLTNSELSSRWTERYEKDTDFANRANAIAKSYGLENGRDPISTKVGKEEIGPSNWWFDILSTY